MDTTTMAELGKSGKYVRLMCNVWWDARSKRVHVTSNDSDLPDNGMHMSVKPDTMSDTNLRVMLNDFGCGPDSPVKKFVAGIIDEIKSGELDAYIDELNEAIESRIKTD